MRRNGGGLNINALKVNFKIYLNIIGANMDLIQFCTKNIEGILDDNKNVMMIKNYNRAYHIKTVVEILNFGN